MFLPDVLPLIPAPVNVTTEAGRLPLAAGLRVLGDSPPAILLAEAITARTGIPATVETSGAPRRGDVVLRGAADAEGEAYTLGVAEHVVVEGSEAGLFYGIQTLRQLLQKDDSGWFWPQVQISDAPRFAYRGVMLDVARHFFTVDEVKTVIDRIAALKFNHLHLHLSDDQGWRIQIDAWPLLTERGSSASASGDGSHSGGGFYSKDDYRALVAHAAQRHVTIVPEIDLPGHTHAVSLAYPELTEEPVISDQHRLDAARLGQALPEAGVAYTGWGVGHSSLRIRAERTYDFVRDVLSELAELTPGPYLHIGGDECWGTSAEDYATFMTRATAIVTELGKTPIAWHEAGAVADLAPGTAGQYWGMLSPDPAHRAHVEGFLARGGAIIISPADAAYLDMKHDPDDPLGLAWAGTVDVQRARDWDPQALLDLAPSSIAGVEAPLWTETVRSADDAEKLMYPRIAAIAELAWSAATHTWPEFRERLGLMAPAWRSEGIQYRPVPEIPWSER